MRRVLGLLSVFFLSLAVPVLAASNSNAYANPFHWSGALQSGQLLTIKNVNGDIHAEAAPAGVAEVTADKTGEGSDEVAIQVVPTSDGVTICAVWPGEDGRQNSCNHSDIHEHSHNNHARVDFTVRVPRNVRLRADTVNGGVEAKDLGSNAEVSSVNGSVEVSTAGWAEATSVNGSVHATLGRSDWTDELRFKSVNGNVEVTVPADLNADVRFSTLNGHVESDFPYTVQSGTQIGRPGAKIEARIGNGGRQLLIESLNGNLQLKKGGI
jgi:DUF4097 and DUF4098 domain-containing protein YvlB